MRLSAAWLSALALALAFGQPDAAQAEGAAEVPLGLWRTGPDDLGVVLHVRTRRCGRALCGRVERAKNRRGHDTPSEAVGEKLLWELRPQADGSFLGEFRDARGAVYPLSRLEMAGKVLRLRACDAAQCREHHWTRLR